MSEMQGFGVNTLWWTEARSDLLTENRTRKLENLLQLQKKKNH